MLLNFQNTFLYVTFAGLPWEWEWELILAPMRIPTCRNPVEIRNSRMWESYGKSHRNPVGMGWE